MSDPSRWTDDELNLATRLRREAAQSAPEFSEERHARVMQSVGQARRAVTTHSRARWFGAAALVAAAIGLLIGAWMLTANRGIALAPPQHPENPDEIQLGNLIPAFPEAPLRTVQSRMEEQRFAYLDRDAQRLASFVVEQLSCALPPSHEPIPR